jgi:hypothetical protein
MAFIVGVPTDSVGRSDENGLASLDVSELAGTRVMVSGATSGGRDEIVCHGDIGPHNTVYRGGMPVAFIDWDAIRPNHPLVEFGNAAWHFVPLGDDPYFGASGFAAQPDLARRLARFAREYGVTHGAELAWALHQSKQRSVEAAKYWPISPAEGAAALRQIASDLDWQHDRLEALVSELD